MNRIARWGAVLALLPLSAGHTTAIATFNDEIRTGQDADTKAFAQQDLPMIQQHLQEARRLQGRR